MFYLHPENWGFMIQFDGPHIFQRGFLRLVIRVSEVTFLGW